MAKKLRASRFDLSLLDSDTDQELKVSKAVDITDHCRLPDKKSRAILLFTQAKRGRIVQITITATPGDTNGTHCHFFVDELDKEMHVQPRDDTFGGRVRRLGLKSKKQLLALIDEHVPDPEVLFLPKSAGQHDDCINRSKEFKCRRKSTLEAFIGNAAIRCCDRSKCMRRAKQLALAATRAGL